MKFRQVIAQALVAVGTFAAVIADGLAQDAKPVPLQSSITQVQPMTGIALWMDNEHIEIVGNAIALEYRYVGYNQVVTGEGHYEFDELDRLLDEVARRNHQAILRFYFCYVGQQTTVPDFIRNRDDYDETVGESEGETTYFCDWSNQALQRFTLEFYSRIAERYDNDPRVAYLQTGFGLWAEYHIYDGPRELGQTFPSKEFQSRFLRHLDSSFESLPWSVSVDAADSTYSPIVETDPLMDLQFGCFDDSFLCRVHPQENALNWQALGSTRWQRQPAGGEFSYYTRRDQRQALAENGPHGTSFQDAAQQFHISYMIGNDQLEYRSINEISTAGKATGYRFRVTSAVWQNETLTIEVENKGVAPIYRDAYFALGERTSRQTLRGLLPGESLTCTIEDVREPDVQELSIECDAILPSQVIQFEADLTGDDLEKANEHGN